jgi:DNA-binding CsgD family transcriptional regulator
MVAIMNKLEIIREKQSGKSNREVARVTGYDRDTV